MAADKATLDVSWTNYFTECKSKGRAYFKGKIQTGGQAGARPGHRGAAAPPRWRRPWVSGAWPKERCIRCGAWILSREQHFWQSYMYISQTRMRSINSTLFGSWQQRCGLPLSVLQLVYDTRLHHKSAPRTRNRPDSAETIRGRRLLHK